VKTYGEILYEIENSRWSMETASAYLQGSESSDAELNVVATEVCVEQPSPGMRFLPPKGLERKFSTSTNKLRLAYCASAADVPNMNAEMLDDILIDLDNDEERGIAMTISERGSSVYYQVRRMNAPSSHTTGKEVSPPDPTFKESQKSSQFTCEFLQLAVPLSLLLRGMQDWKTVDPPGPEPWDDYDRWDGYGSYYGCNTPDSDSYDIDNDSDFWRRAMD
jgi:hypothetical protein